MSGQDGKHWDMRYSEPGPSGHDVIGPPDVFAPFAVEFPTHGRALDIACGRGATSVWLAGRGLDVWGVDISPVAIAQARGLAERHRVADRCRFTATDLDGGLPPGAAVDLIVCHRFRAVTLYEAMPQRLTPGGILAIAVLSEVDAIPGQFRAPAGELRSAFAGVLDIVANGEGDGIAWLIGRKPVTA